jgi:hypothetical protein
MVTEEFASFSTQLQDWRELYRIAMFECDRDKLLSRIREAEEALNLRSRELSAMSGNNREERDAIDHALHRLRTLRYCARLSLQRALSHNSETRTYSDSSALSGSNSTAKVRGLANLGAHEIYAIFSITRRPPPRILSPHSRKQCLIARQFLAPP